MEKKQVPAFGAESKEMTLKRPTAVRSLSAVAGGRGVPSMWAPL